MIKRRTAAVVMAIALILTGCGSDDKKSNKSSKKNSTNVTQEETVKTELNKDTETDSEKETDKSKKTDDTKKSSKNNVKKVDPVQMKATVPEYSYTATKGGSVSSKYLYTYGGLAYETVDDNSVRVYLADGNLFPEDGAISDIDYLGYGLYALRKISDDNVNTVALVNTDGEVLIPFEAASIDWVDAEDETQHRFLKVIYTTEPVESKDDCFIYFTSKVVALAPSEGDLLFDGYALVYDLEKKQFIPNLKVTNSNYLCLEAINGGVLYIDEDDKKTLYSPDGKAVISGKKYDINTDGTVVISRDDNSNYTVYDAEGSVLLETKSSLLSIGGQGGALTLYDSAAGNKYLVDYNGNKLSDYAYSSAYEISAGIVRVSDDSSNASLINFDGSVICENKKSFYSLIPGYFHYKSDSDKEVIVTADGEICPECQDVYYMTAYNEEGNYFVWNTKEYSLKLNKDSVRNVSLGLLYAKNDEGKYGLYDMFTGNMILEGFYDDLKVSGGMVYAYNAAEGKWDIYKISTNVPL